MKLEISISQTLYNRKAPTRIGFRHPLSDIEGLFDVADLEPGASLDRNPVSEFFQTQREYRVIVCFEAFS
jgi:hypothetical protein